MDLWVVAAAAGAGYIAKNLQNLSSVDKREVLRATLKDKVDLQSDSSNFLQQLRDKTCPLRRLGINSPDQLIKRDSEAGLASFSGDALERNEEPGDYNLCWISREFEDREVRSSTRNRRGKLIENRKRREYLIRPLNFSGSFLDSQLCREHEREEHTVPLLSGARPVVVTNGTRMISRSNSDPSFLQFEGGKEEVRKENGACLKVYDSMLGSTSLQQFESVEVLRKEWKRCSGTVHLRGSSDEAPSQGPDGMRHFVVGMTVGILSAATASKNVVDKLNKQLKQTQNLVQDLHEELDMKDILTVKELADDTVPLSSREPNASPSGMKVNYSPKLDKTKEENIELISKIEAELEAELEVLERNMKDSALERISNLVELESDFEPDIVQGDIKPVMGNEIRGAASESGSETTDTTPKYNNNWSQSPYYSVCPWELSIRLHELIESRLEERVKELEIALGNGTPNRFQFPSSHFQGVSPYSETRSQSSPYTPTSTQKGDKSEAGFPAKNFSSNYIDAYKNPNGIWYKHMWSDSMSNADGRSEDDDDDDDDDSTDESDMLLLKQIVERKKLGSRVVLEF